MPSTKKQPVRFSNRLSVTAIGCDDERYTVRAPAEAGYSSAGPDASRAPGKAEGVSRRDERMYTFVQDQPSPSEAGDEECSEFATRRAQRQHQAEN